MTFNNWGGGGSGKTNESLFTATCAASIHEPSDNDGG